MAPQQATHLHLVSGTAHNHKHNTPLDKAEISELKMHLVSYFGLSSCPHFYGTNGVEYVGSLFCLTYNLLMIPLKAFGASSPSPFGGQPKQQGGGGFGSATPFRNMSSPSTNISPFGATSSASNNMSFSNNSFGGRGGFGSNSNTGGCAVKKLPCKFFAQGKCRFGSSCKFSHELDGNQGFQSNQSFNQQNFNSFGGRRR